MAERVSSIAPSINKLRNLVESKYDFSDPKGIVDQLNNFNCLLNDIKEFIIVIENSWQSSKVVFRTAYYEKIRSFNDCIDKFQKDTLFTIEVGTYAISIEAVEDGLSNWGEKLRVDDLVRTLPI